MKKVLLVSCGGLGYGGVSSVILSIVKKLYTKFEFGCVVFKNRGKRENEFLKYGKLHRIEAYNSDGKKNFFEIILRPFKLYWNIFKICKNEHYDVIHANNEFDEGICLLAAKNAGVPIRIAHSHITSSPKKVNFLVKIRKKINRFLIKKSATYKIGCSELACKDFFKDLEYIVIANSIDLEKYNNSTHKIKKNTLTFIHVGRYTYSKNQKFVIKIFYNIKKRVKESRLLLVGLGEDKEELIRLVNSLNLDKSVYFIPGNEVDVSKIYDEADYMIFPSIYEGFGIVLLEAQAKRIPCFVSNVITNEVDAGLLIYINLNDTAEEWAEKILFCIENNNFKTSEETIINNLKKYDINYICEKYSNIYEGNL